MSLDNEINVGSISIFTILFGCSPNSCLTVISFNDVRYAKYVISIKNTVLEKKKDIFHSNHTVWALLKESNVCITISIYNVPFVVEYVSN